MYSILYVCAHHMRTHHTCIAKRSLISIPLSIYLYDNLYEMGGPEKPPSRYQINLKIFLPAVGQWRRKCTSFQSSSSFLTLFSRALKPPILGNRVNFVLLCWQLLRPLIAVGYSCRFATAGQCRASHGTARLRLAVLTRLVGGIKSGGRACQRRD